uniref:UDP-N-acetyl-alpha-D-muramoyl-L-alanyl-L-glutamate epimerase n=1 Tax=Amphimedon queenslandica TaxID=400682 RepID=A0A1X7U0X8_AMPQE
MATRNVQEKERVASLGDTARLELISHSGPQLYMSYRLSGGLYFSTTVWYPFQLEELDTKYGASFMEEIYFHCALFEMNKLCTLAPSLKYIDLGDWSKYFNKKLGELWRVLTIKSFGEWRFLNNLKNWKGPEFFGSDVGCSKNPVISIESGPVRCLAFNGGGKDSLVSMKLLEDIGEPFHSISYAHSMFGQVERQRGLTESLVEYTASKAHHRLSIIDTFLSSPLPGVIPNAEVESIVAFELFSAVFETIPLVLMHGYTSICLGNERSANKGNLVWDGEEINHQWIKSYECESLLSSYIKENLISNLSYFSSLMPVHDPLIFSYLTPYASAVPFTHSCNFGKPWCLRCPKCCYVWLGFSAYFSKDTIHDTFGDENVFDVEENQVFFFQMLGLGTQKPFECIGEVPEVQLAFALCRSKGITGKAMEIFEEKVAANFDVKKYDIIAKYSKVYASEIGIPESLAESMLSKLGQVSEKCKEDILKQL